VPTVFLQHTRVSRGGLAHEQENPEVHGGVGTANQYVWQNQPELYRLKYASPLWSATSCFKRYNPIGLLKRPPIREDLKVLLYQSQEADNTFITSDGTSPYNSTW
jgi:hypothetical protein